MFGSFGWQNGPPNYFDMVTTPLRSVVFLALHGWPLLGWPLIQPYRYRPPRANEARTWAFVLAALSLILFAAFGYPELRKNLVWLPAECQPYVEPGGALVPEIKPYRHCYRSCISCYPSRALTTCSHKMGMHFSLNEYDMRAMRHIAGKARQRFTT